MLLRSAFIPSWAPVLPSVVGNWLRPLECSPIWPLRNREDGDDNGGDDDEEEDQEEI